MFVTPVKQRGSASRLIAYRLPELADVSESEAFGLSWRKTGDVDKPKEGTELKVNVL